MKVRESGMPVETLWNSLFDIDLINKQMEITKTIDKIVEIGCGYGTFTIPASKLIKGDIIAFDIETEMIDIVTKKAKELNISNIQPINCDITHNTTGLQDNSVDYVMLYNILHDENPIELLNEAYRILKRKGKVGIIHWRSDIETPRGPSLNIRPLPKDCIRWAMNANFKIHKDSFILPPYHFGLIILKP